jgi:hypothetical protein
MSGRGGDLSITRGLTIGGVIASPLEVELKGATRSEASVATVHRIMSRAGAVFHIIQFPTLRFYGKSLI